VQWYSGNDPIDMSDLKFRAALSADHILGAHLVMETLHQFGVYLFGFGQKERADQAIQRFFQLTGNRFSHQFAEFALVENEIAGLLMTFDQRQMRWSMAVTALQMLRVYQAGEIGKFFRRILPYREEENIPADEFYVAHLAVEEKFRRRGFGLQMLAHAEEKARERGLPKLSLLTEIENTSARALYEKFGFNLTDTILFPEQMPDVGSAGDVRMVKLLS
jgi:ribosomal protein S18 acetylase RimI-like enzyme